MARYFVIGENKERGEAILFVGSKQECKDWIWDNCDVGDLYRTAMHGWSGTAYYDNNNELYAINVDKFYKN